MTNIDLILKPHRRIRRLFADLSQTDLVYLAHCILVLLLTLFVWIALFMLPIHGGSAPESELARFGVHLVFWQVMMLAMMLPIGLPMMRTYLDIARAARDKGEQNFAHGGWLITGYVIIWALVSPLGAAIHYIFALHANISLADDPALALFASAAIFALAALYQWSKLKMICLEKCRPSIIWFMSHWRAGRTGALVMGLWQGGWCVGCCWALMAVMIASGALHMIVMALLMLVMLGEKLLPSPRFFARLIGVILGAVAIALAGTAFFLSS